MVTERFSPLKPLRDRRGSVTVVSVLEFFTASDLDFVH